MRLFVALPLPPPVLEHLDLAVEAVSAVGARRHSRRGPGPLRWVSDRHITLAFYGEVPGGVVPELTAELSAAVAAFAPVRLRLRGAGSFAHRTLWAGVHEAVDDPGPEGAGPEGAGPDGAGPNRAGGLVALMAACEDVGNHYARLPRRDRRRAHVTLARARAGRAEEARLAELAHALSVYAGPVWTATQAHLVSSLLGAGKGGTPVHEVLAALPLAGGPPPADGSAPADGPPPGGGPPAAPPP